MAEIGGLDGVHVNDLDALESGQGQVPEQLAAQAAGPRCPTSDCATLVIVF